MYVSPWDTSLQEHLLKNKQTLSYQEKRFVQINYSHGNKCLLKKTRGSNELVPLNTFFFTFTSQTVGRGHLLLLKFTLSLHYAVGRPGELLLKRWLWPNLHLFSLLVYDSLSPSQVAACALKTQEKSAQELAVQSGSGQQSHQ